jgi:hypothetical protein
MRGSRALLCAASFALCQCGSRPVAQLSAAPEDYAHYREYRSAEVLADRFRAAGRYLQAEPEGRFRDEVRTWLLQAGGEYLRRWWNDEARLMAYQTWVPEGPHSGVIEARLQALAAQSVAARARDRELLATAARQQNALERAKTLRQELIASYKRWLLQVASLRQFGQPTAALPHEFLHEYREIEPRATCAALGCSKPVLLPYAVPAQRKLSWRELLFDVTLTLDNGVLVEASLHGVALVSSLAEALQRRTVAPDDIQAQAEALGVVVQLSALVLEHTLPATQCERPAISPVVLARECSGVQLEFRVAAGEQEQDSITLRPAPAAKP